MNPASESCSPESSETGESGRMGRDVLSAEDCCEVLILFYYSTVDDQ